MKKVVVIGGGTGTFVVLSGLKKYPLDLSAVVSMADSGGSNKIIRDEFGLLPPSDVRQCLVALADDTYVAQKTLRQLFMYRFAKGVGTKGHTFGNLFLAALSDITGNQVEAIKQAGKILHIKGRVVPVSLTKTNLVAKYNNDMVVKGEHEIDEPDFDGRLHIKKLSLSPRAAIYADAERVIKNANLIVLGPGDLYTSVLANMVVSGVPEALRNTKAQLVYIVNLVTKKGQTYGFGAKDHVFEIEKYIGRKLDFVIFNNGKFPPSIVRKYQKENEHPVVDNLEANGRKVVKTDLLAREEVKKVSGDVLKRSLIRHDPKKLAKVLVKLLKVSS
ncbi:YvcK family protein [Candidatus Gottesmanbacteria bacterium]|nr:YvcK family protein [Candidatus Gottesmanbacteria bacterium]